MIFDKKIDLTGSVTDPDPLSSPATVPDDRIFTLPFRAAEVNNVNNRVIVGVTTTGSGTVLSFELYDVDEDSITNDKADWEWHLVFSGTSLSSGDLVQSLLSNANQAFSGGGKYYLRCTTDYPTTTFKVKAINA